ncbi:X antigen family member 5-like [Sapajus apella]|uniref:X antigen family member 5-like n=1 Tax=Sapajus apella TaxID=9515 RepID=A0A6J3HDH6_SAPAP|nr:X antigen family member 5-like [Sapajus apella]
MAVGLLVLSQSERTKKKGLRVGGRGREQQLGEARGDQGCDGVGSKEEVWKVVTLWAGVHSPRVCLANLRGASPHTHPFSQEPSVPKPQREEPPAESQDHTPGQNSEEDQGGAEIQGAWKVPDLEADLQELSQSKTGDECRDGPDVQGKSVPKSEQCKMPEGGKGKPQD